MKKVFEHCTGEHLTLEHATEWMHRNEERLAPHIITRPDLKPMCPGLYFPKECFPRAEQWIMANSQHYAVYVFGEAVCGGIQQHGWVEIDDAIVFDGVMQTFYDKKGYYQSELARSWYRYIVISPKGSSSSGSEAEWLASHTRARQWHAEIAKRDGFQLEEVEISPESAWADYRYCCKELGPLYHDLLD